MAMRTSGLANLPAPVVAVDPDMCSGQQVHLILRETWTDMCNALKISDATLPHEPPCMVLTNSTNPLSSCRQLWDQKKNHVVAEMRHGVFNILKKRITSKRSGASFEIRGTRRTVDVSFTDLHTGDKVHAGLRGKYPQEASELWIDQGVKGRERVVAQVYLGDPERVERLGTECMDFLRVDIAGNMDKALVVFLIVTLVQAERAERGKYYGSITSGALGADII